MGLFLPFAFSQLLDGKLNIAAQFLGKTKQFQLLRFLSRVAVG